MSNYDTIIIGAGAAGLIAAAKAAEHGASVLVLEKMKQPGRKLMITGKGRCNITNAAEQTEFIKHIQPNGRFLHYAFSQFFSDDIINLLNNCGVKTVLERGNRIFPKSSRAADIVTALIKNVSAENITINCSTQATKLITEENKIKGVEISENGQQKQIFASNIIICTGGKSYPATGSSGDGYTFSQQVGHSITPPRPALVPLETEEKIPKLLHGLTLKNVNTIVWVNGKKQTEEFGELVFSDFGLTGPTILTSSRIVVDELNKNNRVEITIDLKPALSNEKLDARLLRDLNANGKKHILALFKLWLPSQLIPTFLEKSEIDQKKEAHQISGKERKRIKQLMKEFRFKISGYRPFKEAIITAGGVLTKEINSKTMESKLIKNLYFAGEVIDLDADTGGYNLQIAWSTGWLAGRSCAENITNNSN